MPLTTIIILVLALYMVQLFLQETSRFGFDPKGIMGTHDTLPEMSVIASRLDRAKNNMLEALPIFLGLALLTLIKGGDVSQASNAALIFLIARVAYVPAYVSGIPMLRSLIWVAGTASLVMMAAPLI
jgi:uncharacterized MAPEG superfamily protein